MNPAVEIKAVSKSFGQRELLSDITLNFEQGLLHGLVGPGGVGKSVLLSIIATLTESDQGEISLFGQKIGDLGPEKLIDTLKRIGFQFQNLALFDFMDVLNNVAFPLTQGRLDRVDDGVKARVAHALAAVGLPGTETQEIKSLSGGMKRRVAMARAMVNEPDLLILDDPSAGLDPVTSSRIFELIRRVFDQRKNTVILATQDVDRLIKIADRVHILYNGRVHFSGTTEEIWRSNDRIVRQFFPNPPEGSS